MYRNSDVNSPKEEQSTSITTPTTKDSETSDGNSSPVSWIAILVGFSSILLIRILKPKFS